MKRIIKIVLPLPRFSPKAPLSPLALRLMAAGMAQVNASRRIK